MKQSSLALFHGQQTRPQDNEVKAAYLFNFGRFATWPASATAAEGPSINVCVIGRDPFGTVLDSTLAGETIDGKNVAVKRIMAAKDAAGCRILFVSASEELQVSQILEVIGRAAVLTVSDLPGFTARGGMIQFVLQDNRVRFEVNLAAAEQANLKLSSELLKVATTVRGTGRPGE
jgi:YfiR/HmsC-like